MILQLNNHNVLHSEIVFEDNFKNNIANWEINKNLKEQSFIKDGYYWMENKDDHNWHYFKNVSPLKRGENFIIDTDIEIMSPDNIGHIGLVWGFDDKLEQLNRFCISGDGDRLLVTNFERNNLSIFHRYQSWRQKIDTKMPIRLSIIKIDKYFHFLINEKLVYSCNGKHFTDRGPLFGYYIEPGILIRSSKMKITRLITKAVTDDSISQLLKN